MDLRRSLGVGGTGLGVGLLAGFFGIGGGFLIVPGLILATRMPMIEAIGTSLLAVVVGSVLLLAGGFGVLAGSSVVPGASWLAGLGLLGVCLGVGLSGRRAARTRYRPAPVGTRSIACGASGWLAALLLAVAGAIDPARTAWSPWPLAWPQATPLALGAVLCGLVPLLVAPAEARSTSPTSSIAPSAAVHS